MCAVCLAIQMDMLTKAEAKRALLEVINTDLIDDEHKFVVADLIEEKTV
jgi:hypothetical protein